MRPSRRATEISAHQTADMEEIFDLEQVDAEVIRSRAHEDDVQGADMGAAKRQNTFGLVQLECGINPELCVTH